MNVRIVDGDDCCPQAMCVKVCNLVQEVRKTGASKKLIPSEKAVSDALKGRQELLVAGAADGILGPSAATGLAKVLTAPSSGVSIVDAIKGRTLKWNQAIIAGLSQTAGGLTITGNADGSYTIDGENDTGDTVYLNITGNAAIPTPAGHKYLLTGAQSATLRVGGYFSGAIPLQSSDAIVIALTTNPQSEKISIVVSDGWTGSNVKIYPQFIDLTDLFGAGNEPATVAEFTALFPDFPYYYNAGTLLPFKGTGLKVTGFNQWDEEWELGGLTPYGEPDGNTDRICSKNFIQIIPNTQYYIGCINSTLRGQIAFYDAGKNFIKNEYGNPGDNGVRTIILHLRHPQMLRI